jgi:hypothetical protein
MKYDDCYIELIKEVDCNNDQEYYAMLYDVVKNTDNAINKLHLGRTKKEQNKLYRLENPDKIKQYRIDNADKLKEWRDNNADRLKEYRLINAEKLKEYKNKKHDCNICGGKYTSVHKLQHFATLRHTQALGNNVMDKHEHKQTNLSHLEQIKKWQLDNIDRVKEYRSTKLECNICHGFYTMPHRNQHKRSSKHRHALHQLYDKLDEQFNEITILYNHCKTLHPKIHLDCTLI